MALVDPGVRDEEKENIASKLLKIEDHVLDLKYEKMKMPDNFELDGASLSLSKFVGPESKLIFEILKFDKRKTRMAQPSTKNVASNVSLQKV